MSIRDTLVMGIIYLSLPWIPFSPFYGLLVYSWVAFMRPHDLAWGLRGTPVAFYVAVLLLVGLGVAVLRGQERLLTLRPQTVLMLALLGWFALSTQFALAPFSAQRELNLLSKVILISVITTGLVSSNYRFRLVYLVTAISLGLLALKFGLFGLIRGGAIFDSGPGGFMKDNNGFAVGMNMALPLVLGIFWAERARWLRILGLVLAFFCVVTVIFTFSRGGFLTLAVVGLLLILRSRKRLVLALALVLGISIFATLTPESFREDYRERLDTISSFEEDGSAMGRIRAWRTAIRVFEDYPWLGVGPDNFLIVYPNYSNETEVRVAHNAFLQLLAEVGLPGASIWLLLILVTLFRLDRLRRHGTTREIQYYATAMQISIVAYFVGSIFLDKAIFDLFYHLVALSVGLELVHESLADDPTLAPQPSEIEAWWRQPATSSPSAS